MRTTTTTREHRVTVPEGEVDGVRVARFDIGDRNCLQNMLEGARATSPGTYTRLDIDGHLWMSDTDAEWRDHREAVWRIQRPETRTVLINGLGLGMVVQAALDCPHVERVDVVEVDPRVVALVGPHYLRDPRVRIHTADAYTVKWPTGTRWDVAWHDIWRDLCTDNLAEMGRLHRRYGRRCGWQGSWGRPLLEMRRDQERRSGWW